jgi:hypothetical protein
MSGKVFLDYDCCNDVHLDSLTILQGRQSSALLLFFSCFKSLPFLVEGTTYIKFSNAVVYDAWSSVGRRQMAGQL